MIHFSKRIRATFGSFSEASFFCKHLRRFKSLRLHFGFPYVVYKDISNLCTLFSSWEYGWFCSYSQDTRLFCNIWLVGEDLFIIQGGSEWSRSVLQLQHLSSFLDWLRLRFLPCYWTSSLFVWEKYWLRFSLQLFWGLYTCKQSSLWYEVVLKRGTAGSLLVYYLVG